MRIILPHEFKPRWYQAPVYNSIPDKFNRGVCVWHRRAGKDKTFINIVGKESQKRVGAYYYYFPTGAQGRKILWNGMDKSGFRFIDHFPKEIIDGKPNDTEMRIRFKNGSIFQIIGTDRLEVVGPNPVGCVFSEFSLQNPKAWNYVRPILMENEGWALFNFTPRGMNHAFDLHLMARDNPKWFHEVLTVDDTKAITQEVIDEEIAAGMSPDLVEQEFYCSFEYGLEGAYYLKYINKARKEGRIGNVPIADLPVFTFWDIGRRDSTAVWFVQLEGLQIRLIDYFESHGESVPYYAKMLRDKGYTYAMHFGPHDMENTYFSQEFSAKRLMADQGFEFKIVPKLRTERLTELLYGIELAKSFFYRCWFDKKRCQDGLNALMNYKKEWMEDLKRYKDVPEHDWTSHGCDAFRMMAVALKVYGNQLFKTEVKPRKRKKPPSAMAA